MPDWDPGFPDLPALDAIGEQIVDAARSDERSMAARTARPGRRQVVPRGPRRGLLVVVLVLGLTGATLAAARLIQTGRPVPRAPGSLSRLGQIVPGTTRLLSVRAADPDGGPPWGLRVFRTRSRVACVQVGRVVDGRLGVLGQDGVFHDDGRFHELPVAAEGCGGLDGAGQMFMSGGANTQTASGFDGSGAHVVGGCETREDRRIRTVDTVPSLRDALRLQLQRGELAAARVERRVIARYLRRARQRIALCPDADLRDAIWGFEGSLAQRVTLVEHGRARSVTPVTRDGGAYLVVLRGSYRRHRSLQRATTYPHGIVCARGLGAGSTAKCNPPPGFKASRPRALPPALRRLAHRASHPPPPLHIPISVFPGLAIRFTPPAAGHRYQVTLRCHRTFADVVSGKLLARRRPQTVRLRGPLPPFCSHARGIVNDATTGGQIGTFRLRASR